MTQRDLAEAVGKAQSHVSYMARVWRDHHGDQSQSFDRLYQLAKVPEKPRAIAPAKPAPDDSAPERPLTATTVTDRQRASRYGKMATDIPSRPPRDTGDDEEAAEQRRLLAPVLECMDELQQYADHRGIGLPGALRLVLKAGFAAEASGDEEVSAHAHRPRPRRSGRGAGW